MLISAIHRSLCTGKLDFSIASFKDYHFIRVSAGKPVSVFFQDSRDLQPWLR